MSEETQSEAIETDAQVEATETHEMKGGKGPTWKMVSELRLEAARNRVRASDLEAAQLKAERDFETRLADQVSQAKTEAQAEAKRERAITRLEAQAIKDGLMDPDFIALMDLSALALDDDGKATNATELLASFKAAKPHLFASTATSSAAKTPKATTETKKVSEMTDAEYAAHKRSKLGL